MIDTVMNLLFRCPHRRLTRPITPVSKPGVPSGDTYVVCLDCGKQFLYDWKEMRMGKAAESTAATGVLPPEHDKPRAGGLKYALLGSALPLVVLFGKALLSKPGSRRKTEPPQAGGSTTDKKAAGSDSNPQE